MNNLSLAEKMILIEEEFAPIQGWYPLEAQIEITYDCTLRCAMCYNGVRANEKKFSDYLKECDFSDMNEEKRKKIMNVLIICLENGAKFFTITGGEPLLYPDVVIQIIKKVKEHGGYVSINSNATVIDAKLAKKLKEAGLNSALISIHGADDKTHAKTVCVKDAFDLTINGIKNLIDNGVHVVPNFVASHVNVDQLKKTAEMLYHMGIKTQAYSIFIPTPGVQEHDILKMTDKDNKVYFEQLYLLNKNYSDLKATATLPVPPCLSKGIVDPKSLEKFEFRTCPSGRQFIVVNAEGNASPCIQLAWNEKYGSNVIDYTKLETIEKLSQWKKLFNTPQKCVNCGCKGFCNPCNMNILRENNSEYSHLSIPYPNHDSLTDDEAKAFKSKFEIIIPEDNWGGFYKLKEHIIFREELGGYLTVINPKIQGYTIIKDVCKDDLSGNIIFAKPEHFKLFMAMGAIEIADNNNCVLLDKLSVAPKYKVLTELIGHDFNNHNAIYFTRTDTAGRYFCLPNTVQEQKLYNDAKQIYYEYTQAKDVALQIIKKDRYRT